jgi:hypothetical protein
MVSGEGVDADAIMRRHGQRFTMLPPTRCDNCGTAWPCDAAALVAELAVLRERNKWLEFHADDLAKHGHELNVRIEERNAELAVLRPLKERAEELANEEGASADGRAARFILSGDEYVLGTETDDRRDQPIQGLAAFLGAPSVDTQEEPRRPTFRSTLLTDLYGPDASASTEDAHG